MSPSPLHALGSLSPADRMNSSAGSAQGMNARDGALASYRVSLSLGLTLGLGLARDRCSGRGVACFLVSRAPGWVGAGRGCLGGLLASVVGQPRLHSSHVASLPVRWNLTGACGQIEARARPIDSAVCLDSQASRAQCRAWT